MRNKIHPSLRFSICAGVAGLLLVSLASPPSAPTSDPSAPRLPGHVGRHQTTGLARAAVTGNPADASAARRALREKGSAGLDELFTAWPDPGSLSARDLEAFSAAVDQVGQQKDCRFSRLFWYTDLDEALHAASASGKPLLSLWMLGSLTEEYSCANSRFFRTVLYANLEVANFLRDHFILHWHSVRPAPKITVDFGDGRRLARTITGNSIHYVLTPNGEPFDALPGLYTPPAFLEELGKIVSFLTETRPGRTRPSAAELEEWHRVRVQASSRAREVAFRRSAADPLRAEAARTALAPLGEVKPTAENAGVRAFSKMIVERPLVAAVTGRRGNTPEVDARFWAGLGGSESNRFQLDANSEALIREKLGWPGRNPKRWGAILESIQETVRADTYLNEFMFRPRIHEWLLANRADLRSLNEFVYRELFLTPSTDRWLGLAPSGVFSALPNQGLEE